MSDRNIDFASEKYQGGAKTGCSARMMRSGCIAMMLIKPRFSMIYAACAIQRTQLAQIS
jgi:hypothetical protein